MPSLPPRDGVDAPPCAGIRAGASTVSTDATLNSVVGPSLPLPTTGEHDATGSSGSHGIASPSPLHGPQEHGGGVYTSKVLRPLVWVVGTHAHVIWGVNANIFPSPSRQHGGGEFPDGSDSYAVGRGDSIQSPDGHRRMGCSRMSGGRLRGRTRDPRVLGRPRDSPRAVTLLGDERWPSTLFAPLYKRAAPCECSDGGPARPMGAFLPRCDVHLSLPPAPSQGGENGSDGTHTCHTSTGVKPIDEQGATSYYACSFDEDCISTTNAVFVFSLPSNSTKGGSKPGRASSRHRPSVLEAAHLASSLVRPAGSIEAEAPPSPSTVPWRIVLCQLGSGQSSSNPSPDRKVLRPEGITPSLPHPWPAATTAEEGSTTQTTASSPRSKASAPCSRFWRGPLCMPLILWATQTMAASDLLGVGGPTLTTYMSPTSAASKIQYAYRHHIIRRNRLLLPCLRGHYKSRIGSAVATDEWAATMNSYYRSKLVSMYREWANLPFAALMSYLSDLRRLHITAWPPMSSDYTTMMREYAVRTVLLSRW